MEPRNINKPIMPTGNYCSWWFDENLKFIRIELSNKNRIDLIQECEKKLQTLPDGYSFIVALPVHNSLIKHNGVMG